MKNTILLLSFLLLFSSCDKDKGRLRQDAKVAITGVESYTVRAASVDPDGIMGTDITDSVKFIAKYAESFNYKTLNSETEWGATSFGSSETTYRLRHDTINNKLLYLGGHVINAQGELGEFIVDCRDACFYVFQDKDGNAIFPINYGTNPEWIQEKIDTVAYIPNAVIRKARVEIMDAFAREDYEACYRLFDEAFVFVPTTGAKWRAMKAAGIE